MDQSGFNLISNKSDAQVSEIQNQSHADQPDTTMHEEKHTKTNVKTTSDAIQDPEGGSDAD